MRALTTAVLLLCVVLTLALAALAQAVVYVNSESLAPIPDGAFWQTAYRSIQQAINDSDSSTEPIWVARGTYSEKITLGQAYQLYGGFAGTETDLAQRNLAANPTGIDAGGAGNAISVSADARIDGFTIANAEYGVYALSCSPTITNNTITRCTAYGVYCFLGSPSITYNSIAHNAFGIGCESSSPSITNNTLAGNSEYAIYCLSGAPVVSANTMQANYGGIYTSSGNIKARRNTISGSAACGVYCCEGVSATVAGNLMIANDEGVRVDGINPSITNNTLVSSARFGIFLHDGAPAISNNIIMSNSTGIARFGGSATLSRNNVFQNGLDYGEGIAHATDLQADPLFVADGDYHLTPGSPCVNAGDGAAAGIPGQDIDGQTRIQGSAVDIGADELAGTPEIRTARLWGAGMPAGLENAVVSACFGDFFYVQKSDRTCGVRIEKIGEPSHHGWRVNVTGTIKLNADGELYIEATNVEPVEPATVQPMIVRNRDLGGSPVGMQDGVWSWQWNWHPEVSTWAYEWTQSMCPNNIGILLSTWGRVTNIGDGYLYIDDGSRLDDGTSTGLDRNIGLRVTCDSSQFSSGDYLTITGISSCFRTSSGLARRILPLEPGGIRKIAP